MGDVVLILMAVMIAAVFAYISWDALHHRN